MRANLSSKQKQNKGFTLTEMLITIAIIVILLGISIVGIAKLAENLKMAEMDDYAKIIYLQAQDQLGILEVEGALDAYHSEIRTAYPANAESLTGEKHFLKDIYTDSTKAYYPYLQDYPTDDTALAAKMWENMCYLAKDSNMDLDDKMISHTSDIYLNGGSYLIEFNPKTGDVYGVFYWESDTAIDYENDIKTLATRKRADRKSKKIGYYGGTLAGDVEEEESLLFDVALVNGEELYLKISFDKDAWGMDTPSLFDSHLNIAVEITGERGNKITFNVPLDRNYEYSLEGLLNFYVLLDSMYEGFHFHDIVNNGVAAENQILPGENLTIEVKASYTGSGSLVKDAETVQGNSLFANDTNDDQISLSALRHMMNLDKAVYDGNDFVNRNKIQYLSDIDFNEDAYRWKIDSTGVAIHLQYGTTLDAAEWPLQAITPIENDTVFKSYTDADGNTANCVVTSKSSGVRAVLKNFIVNPAQEEVSGTLTEQDNVALFGKIENTDFSNIYVEDIIVNAAERSNVGALIGCMKDGSITDCGVYLSTLDDTLTHYSQLNETPGICHKYQMDHRYDTYRIKGKTNVGGLVGMVEATKPVTIDKAFAAIKVGGADSTAVNIEPKIEGAASNAGGLIGYVKADIPEGEADALTIQHSYASGDVFGKDYVGGFVGGVDAVRANSITVEDNYSTGDVYGDENFGGFLGQTTKAAYKKCISYGELIKLGIPANVKYTLKETDRVGGFVPINNSAGASYENCVYMSQPGYNKAAVLVEQEGEPRKNPTGVTAKEYGSLISTAANTMVQVSYPYSRLLYLQGFPFEKLAGQKNHYGNWPEKFMIDTSLVYYERYSDGSYGYYCVTATAGNDKLWLLDTLKDESDGENYKECIEDGYGLLTKYNLEKISYDLYIGNQERSGNKYEHRDINGHVTERYIKIDEDGTIRDNGDGTNEDKGDGHAIGKKKENVEIKELSENDPNEVYQEEVFVYRNRQGNLKFEEITDYDAETGTVEEYTGESFEVASMYLYQLPYDLQCTDRKQVSYFYDRIVFDAMAKGGSNKKVIDNLSFLYSPHFAKTAYNPNVSDTEVDLSDLETVEQSVVKNPKNVYIRSARQLNALGRFPYYWNSREGSNLHIDYIQEKDINFSTYTKVYAGREFDLQAFGKTYSNRPIGNSELGAVGADSYAGSFKHNYDGRGYKIIDYCLSVSDVQFVGLFGEIQDTILKNIVMVMSSAPEGPAEGNEGVVGLITSDFKTWKNIDGERGNEMRASVGALVGMAYDNSYCDDWEYTNSYINSNKIENCVVSGYTVQYEVNNNTVSWKQDVPAENILEPLGIVLGGLIGYGESDVSNCSVVNDVVLNLKKDYTNTYAGDGYVNMGGFVGSYMYSAITDCYSGGTIKVLNNGARLSDNPSENYLVPNLKIGGFCPGWLDTRAKGLGYGDWYLFETGKKTDLCSCGDKDCMKDATSFYSVKYDNIYSYTTVVDSVWNIPAEKDAEGNVTATFNHYVPLVSRGVDFFVRGEDKWIEDYIPGEYVQISDAYYLQETAGHHLQKMLDDDNPIPEKYYLENTEEYTAKYLGRDKGGPGAWTSATVDKNHNITKEDYYKKNVQNKALATGVPCDVLTNNVTRDGKQQLFATAHKATQATTYANADKNYVNEYTGQYEAYPYQAVVRKVNPETGVAFEGQYVHYGPWHTPLQDTSIVYYEGYDDDNDGDVDSYGYYCVTETVKRGKIKEKVWILDTLRDQACIEDGYGLLSKHDLDSLKYNNETNGITGTMDTFSDDNKIETEGVLPFKAYNDYHSRHVYGIKSQDVSMDASELYLYMYKLPYELMDLSKTISETIDSKGIFYDAIKFTGTVNGAEVFKDLDCRYNPHFAKTAINVKSKYNNLPNPIYVYVRSARQLNALGRNDYYWERKSAANSDTVNNDDTMTFIQETDINFSTYGGTSKTYLGHAFDLQAFDQPYSNTPIGRYDIENWGNPNGFKNIYDGCSNLIIDYCVKADDTPYAGLFGVLRQAKLQNIVMVVSSEATGNAGKIISNYRVGNNSKVQITDTFTQETYDERNDIVGVGSLAGWAYGQLYKNIINNCAVSGYTVQYEHSTATGTDPNAVAIGGFIGLSQAPITDCTATNQVGIKLNDNYAGRVFMGGFAGSHMYRPITNCYSGGTIDIVNTDKTISNLRVGGFCPGWLDEYNSNCYYNNNAFNSVQLEFRYKNVYSYAEVSDRIWDVNATSMIYVPSVSALVEYKKGSGWALEDVRDAQNTNTKSVIEFSNNEYVESLSIGHLKKTSDDAKKYYMAVDGREVTATGVTFAGLKAGDGDNKVTDANTFVTYKLADGTWDASTAYPYPAVVKDMNVAKKVNDNNGVSSFKQEVKDYVHYGPWLDGEIRNALAYYEKYADNTYGYYAEVTDTSGNADNPFVINTLRDETCIEDGYGLLTACDLDFDTDSLTYELFAGNLDTAIEAEIDLADNEFDVPQIKDREGRVIEEAKYLKKFYKLPFELQFNETKDADGNSIVRNGFYDFIIFHAETDGEEGINSYAALYNPHFAKTAINPVKAETYGVPTEVSVRSARQLNALGRNSYYWQLKDGNGGKVNYIQETDINFSTYGDNVQETGTDNFVKKYLGQDFGIQEFNVTYSNKPIGQSGKSFINNYDGCSNAIIDYCVDGGIDEMYVGLFGQIKEAALKNIVMVVSSNPGGEGGKITSSFQVQSGGKIALRAGVGALIGFAYEENPISKPSNTIKNCAASGYTVWYELKDMLKDYDPVGVAVGGLVGHSQSDISDSSATNDVRIVLHRDYNKTYFKSKRSVVNLGGFVGSFMYAQVSNCYSGGKIDVVNAGNYKIWSMNVGGFCPGWLDILCGTSFVKFEKNSTITNEQKIAYKNIYSYTEVSDNIWNSSNTITNYFPLVSRMAYFIYADNLRVAQPISDSHIIFDKENNMYVESLSTGHLKKMTGDRATNKVTGSTVSAGPTVSVDSFYMEDGENCTATGVTFAELKANATATAERDNTFINGDTDTDGNLIPYSEAYPYPAVVQNVDGEYVHYGPWSNGEIRNALAYYEKYADGKYGYYAKVTDTSGNADNPFVINTLRNESCIEDGYGLLTECDLSSGTDSLNYELFAGNQNTATKGVIDLTDGNKFDVTFTLEGAGHLHYFYKLPFDLQFNEIKDAEGKIAREGFYDFIIINARKNKATDNEEIVINNYVALYNPHFAKTAINPVKVETYTVPTEIYIRSARQLNALGRNNLYYRDLRKKTFIQETDINFSTYSYEGEKQIYLGKEFAIQKFGNTYSNQVFDLLSNTYDGRGNQIIDYCLSSEGRFVGLFGTVRRATLKNIVMVVSSAPKGDGGTITSSYVVPQDSSQWKGSVGALAGRTYEYLDEGVLFKDNTATIIKNCAVSGYTVQYVLEEGKLIGDATELAGVAIGGLVGISMSEIRDCTANNRVVLKLERNYQHKHGDYGRAYLGGFVGSQTYAPVKNCYSGGIIDVVDNRADKSENKLVIKIGGFCPGWLSPGFGSAEGAYGADNYFNEELTKGIKIRPRYENIYSYTEVSDNAWDIMDVKHYVPLVSNMVEMMTGETAKDRWQTYKLSDDQISFENNIYVKEITAARLEEVPDDAIVTLKDGTNCTIKSFYTDAATEMTLKELEEYKKDVRATADNTFVTYDSASGTWDVSEAAYPYQPVVRKADVVDADGNAVGAYVHYGPWPDGAVKSIIAYYEKYEENDYGFHYVRNDGKVISTITTEPDKTILSAGYGYLTTSSEDTDNVNTEFARVIMDGQFYYLKKMTEDELAELLPTGGAAYTGYTYTYKSQGMQKSRTIFVNANFGAAISTKEDLGTDANHLQVRTKEQFENIGTLKPLNPLTQKYYIKQTHDIDMNHASNPVDITITEVPREDLKEDDDDVSFDVVADITGATNINAGVHYDGASDQGCVIQNASDTVFAVNDGTISNTKVVAFDSSKKQTLDSVVAGFVGQNNGTVESSSIAGNVFASDSAAGFVVLNKGTITKCKVGVDNEASTVVNGGMAFGFAKYNYDSETTKGTANISECNVTAKVKANTNITDAQGKPIRDYTLNVVEGCAAGFVGDNTGSIDKSLVTLVNDGEEAVIEGDYASGFAIKIGYHPQHGKITNSGVEGVNNAGDNGTIKATYDAVGFIRKNFGDISNSYVRAKNSYKDLVIQGNLEGSSDAFGFVYANNASYRDRTNGILTCIENCYVVGTVKAYTNAAGFVGSNNEPEILKNCYANTNVSASLTNEKSKASGFAYWSGGRSLYDPEDPIEINWIQNCYATGTVSGYTTSGFLYAGFASDCYTIVEHVDGTFKKPWIDNILKKDTDVETDAETDVETAAETDVDTNLTDDKLLETAIAEQLKEENNIRWGYDPITGFNSDLYIDPEVAGFAKTLAELDGEAEAGIEAVPFNEDLGQMYPYPNVGLTHYGDWPKGMEGPKSDKVITYYEKYEDRYGFYYVNADGSIVSNLTDKHDESIKSAGYGYLTTSEADANTDVNISLGGEKYYLQEVTDWTGLLVDGETGRYQTHDMKYSIDGTETTMKIYMNPNFGAALTANETEGKALGTVNKPLQVRTKAQFEKIGTVTTSDSYIEQTHDVDLAGGHTRAKLGSGITYDGSQNAGCVIVNATDTPFQENKGTIQNTRVASYILTGKSDQIVAGFVNDNYGTISNCSVVGENENDIIIKNIKTAGGFVYKNCGTIKECSVGNMDSKVPAVITGTYVFGFATYNENGGTIDNCTAIVKTDAKSRTAGFVGVNKSTITNSNVYLADNGTGATIHCSATSSTATDGTVLGAFGYAYQNENNGTIENCKVIAVGNGFIEGINAYGFVQKNSAGSTVKNCSVEATIKGVEEAVGFVDDNYGLVEGTEEVYMVNATMEAADVYGFAEKNKLGGIINSCWVTVKAKATGTADDNGIAAGFIEVNMGTITSSRVDLADSDTEPAIYGRIANGFAYTNEKKVVNGNTECDGNITGCKVRVIGTGTIQGKYAYGFIYSNTGGATIDSSSVKAHVKGSSEATGFIDVNAGIITNNCATGDDEVEFVVEGKDAFGFAEKNESGGTITESYAVAKVKATGTEDGKGKAAGFIEENLGTISDSSVAIIDGSTYKAIYGKEADGFAHQNGGTIGGCNVIAKGTGTIEGTSGACGFVRLNGYKETDAGVETLFPGTVSWCRVNSDGHELYIKGYKAYGFAKENSENSTLKRCTVIAKLTTEGYEDTSKTNDSDAAYGMVGTNWGLLEYCHVGATDVSEATVLIQGTRAYGFIRENWNEIRDCSVVGTGQTTIVSTATPITDGKTIPDDDPDRGMAFGFVSDNYGTIKQSSVNAVNGRDDILIQGEHAYGFMYRNRTDNGNTRTPSVIDCTVKATIKAIKGAGEFAKDSNTVITNCSSDVDVEYYQVLPSYNTVSSGNTVSGNP